MSAVGEMLVDYMERQKDGRDGPIVQLSTVDDVSMGQFVVVDSVMLTCATDHGPRRLRGGLRAQCWKNIDAGLP